MSMLDHVTLISIVIKGEGNSKKDQDVSAEVAGAKHAQRDRVNVVKAKYSRDFFKPIQGARGAITTVAKHHSLGTMMPGVYCVPKARVGDFYQAVSQKLEAFHITVREQADKLPQEQALGQSEMGDLYDPGLYPTRDAFIEAHHVDITPVEVSKPMHSFGQQIDELMQRQVERAQARMQASVNADIAKRMQQYLEAMIRNLRDRPDDPSKPAAKRMHASMVDNVRHLTGMLEALGTDPALVKEMRDKLCVHDTSVLKENPPLRRQVQKSADDIMARMSGFMGFQVAA